VFRTRPELLVAVSVPVLLVAGVLPWQRDVICARAGCGTVSASAWSGSPVWAVVLLAALAVAGAWVLVLPTRGVEPLAVAALTGTVGAVATALVVVSLDALVFNRAGFFGFDLPVTETFPVLSVHPGPGLVVGLLGLLLQAVAGWTSLRRRQVLLPPLRRTTSTPIPDPQPLHRAAAQPAPPSQGPGAAPPQWTAAAQPPIRSPSLGAAPRHRAAAPDQAPPTWTPRPDPAGAAGQAPATRAPGAGAGGAAGQERAAPGMRPGWGGAGGGGRGWEAAFGQGAPPPRRHRRR
jgi:hypothetical protein